MQEYRMQSTKPKIRVHTRLAAAASAHFTPSAALLPDRPCHTAGGVEDGRRGNGDGAPEDKAANATLGHPPCSSHSPATHSALPAPPGKQSRRRFGSQPPAKRAARKPPAAPPTAARTREGGGEGRGAEDAFATVARHRRIVLVLSRGVALSAAAPPTEPDGEASTDGEAFGRLGRRIRKHLKMTRREALGRRIRTPQCARRQRRH